MLRDLRCEMEIVMFTTDKTKSRLNHYNYILESHLSQNIQTEIKECSITSSLSVSTCTYRTNNISICFTFLLLFGSTNPVIKHIGYIPQMLQSFTHVMLVTSVITTQPRVLSPK